MSEIIVGTIELVVISDNRANTIPIFISGYGVRTMNNFLKTGSEKV